MMVVAVGITSDEVRSLASQAPAVRAGRLPGLKCLVVSVTISTQKPPPLALDFPALMTSRHPRLPTN